MPNMISLRKFRLASTSGHVVFFEPNKPTPVPKEAVREAMEQGCVPADAKDAPEFVDATKPMVEFSGTLRTSLLYLVIARMIEENDTKSFDSGGRPKAVVLSKQLGFDVSVKEVKEVHRTVLEAMAQDATPELHVDAEAALEVIDAETKGELLELADAMNVPKKETDGLTSRKLRALLLSKYTGVTKE